MEARGEIPAHVASLLSPLIGTSYSSLSCALRCVAVGPVWTRPVASYKNTSSQFAIAAPATSVYAMTPVRGRVQVDGRGAGGSARYTAWFRGIVQHYL